MRIRKLRLLLLLLSCTVLTVHGQTYNQMDPSGNITQRNESGNFNPYNNDTTSNKEVPFGVHSWRVDRRFGDIIPEPVDTAHHLYQNTIHNTGIYGEYNTIGNNYTARQNRIFTDRKPFSQFFFTDAYSFTNKEPDEFQFLNTLSPFTNISYESCGNKQHGEDHIDAKFGVNVNKRLGFGFDLDYHYGLGYFANQSTSHFRTTFYSTYVGDKYQMHLIGSLYHRKATENGGITDDEYITHPESKDGDFTEEEIPTVLSYNWNRNNSQHLFLTHRYNIGFYRKVPMTAEEIKAREFAQKSAKQKEERNLKDMSAPQTNGRQDGKIAGNEPKGRPADAKIVGNEPIMGKPQLDTDTTRIKVDSDAKADSLKRAQALQDSIDATMKKVYVPVTSIIHTLDLNNYDRSYLAYKSPADYYQDTYYNLNDERLYRGDSIYDKTKYLSIKNTFALALLEGFNKYMKAGLKGFVSFEYRKFQMPDLVTTPIANDFADTLGYFMNKWTEHCLNVGGQISRRQGKVFHFDIAAELGVTGMESGSLAVDFNTDLNFPLFGDTVSLAANAYFHRTTPSFFMERYHSKHLWWDKELDKEIRTHIEGIFRYQKTHTTLRVAVDEIKNYTYLGLQYAVDEKFNRIGMTGSIYQESGAINVITAQLQQNFRLGPINWENIVTYQNSSNKDVLPLPQLNLFSNLFLKFKIARVLSVELGGCVTWFSKYYAPDYLPMLSQFAIQKNADSRVELGGYPFVDVYANLHLKRARFFVAMTHINAGSGNRMQFLTPHYPMNNNILHMGVSWNFIN